MTTLAACICMLLHYPWNVKPFVSVLVLLLVATPAFPQLAEELTIRYDLRRTRDGRYQGLAYGEIRSFANPGDSSSVDFDHYGTGTLFQYRLEELSRDGRLESRKVVDRQSAIYEFRDTSSHISPSFATPYSARFPTLWLPPDKDILLLQNFPVRPPEPLREGLVWQAPAVYLAEPGISEEMTRVPVLVEYRVTSPGEYNGEAAWNVEALYAIRYRGDDRFGNPAVMGIQGSHRSSIVYSGLGNQDPLFFRTQVEEAYSLQGNSRLEQRGFLLGFYSFPIGPSAPLRIADGDTTREETLAPGRDPSQLLPDTSPVPDLLEEIKQELTSSEDIEVTKAAEGYTLEIQNLLFVADQAILLPQEGSRLDAIADLLKRFPGRQFLITGHTAAVGSIESQIDLSILRAKTIVDELVARGIEARRLMYEGRGGFVPLADNSTEEGRQRNRRVEITVIDL